MFVVIELRTDEIGQIAQVQLTDIRTSVHKIG